MQRIVVTGFMGAGKSTVGRLLAMRLNWHFVDSDQALERQSGMTIARAFELLGEPAFRDLEHQTIQQLLQESRLVLSLGGGALESEQTRNLILQDPATHLVHLEASLDTVLLRCQGTEHLRPLLRDRDTLAERYQRRLPRYRQAHKTLTVDQLTPYQVVAELLHYFQALQAKP